MGNERLLESKTLVASMEDRAVQYESLKKQFVSLKNAFQKIVDLDGFKGQGARAIKGFYQGQIEVVDSWISICNVRIAFFNGISGSTEDVDLSGDTLVQVPFLKEELYTGHTQSKEMVDAQRKSLKSIFDRINDLVSLQPFSKEDFEEKIDQANKKRKDTMEQVANLDEGLVEEYASSEYLENMMVGLFSALLDATSQAQQFRQ
ncbi:T7SS effector LXG polymorphic toxin [Virgibacillus halodenitrificans]|uniref:T7SS effector LXG polymorphic toxin n=1 Tax=Virgibacillus halodenitrificans TaxID=1482 RepID=UPI0007617337